jgi:hypothetical protein
LIDESTRELRDSAQKLVRNVLAQYMRMKHTLFETSVSVDLGALLARIEMELGRPVRIDSPAHDFVMTMDCVVREIDLELGVKGACTAAGWRLIFRKPWSFIADGLHRSESRSKEIVDDAMGKLLAQIIARGITEDYRELPGLAEIAA